MVRLRNKLVEMLNSKLGDADFVKSLSKQQQSGAMDFKGPGELFKAGTELQSAATALKQVAGTELQSAATALKQAAAALKREDDKPGFWDKFRSTAIPADGLLKMPL